MTDQRTPSTSDHVAASRFVAQARDSFVASGSDVGPHHTFADGSRVAAFRSDSGRVRFEVVEVSGAFADFNFHGAARHFAAKRSRGPS